MILCTFFASTAHIFLKFGAERIDSSNIMTVINLPLFFGLMFFGIGALFMMVAFKHGELSIVFPILATSYVWVSLLSPIFFTTDSMNIWKWTGVIIILLSISLLGFKSTEKKVVNLG
jgi:uncharacterized membrane protein